MAVERLLVIAQQRLHCSPIAGLGSGDSKDGGCLARRDALGLSLHGLEMVANMVHAPG